MEFLARPSAILSTSSSLGREGDYEQSADDLGQPGNDDYYGAGRVNALRAVLQQ